MKPVHLDPALTTMITSPSREESDAFYAGGVVSHCHDAYVVVMLTLPCRLPNNTCRKPPCANRLFF